MRHLSRAASPLTLAAALLLSFSAHAADNKTFPGATCKSSWAHATSFDAGWAGLWYTSDAAVGNLNTSLPVEVNCPIVRDTTTSGVGFNWANINVFGNGREIQCEITMNDLETSSLITGLETTTVVGYTVLEFGTAFGAPDWSTVIRCDIPRSHPTNGNAFIKAITISEP